MKTSFFALSVFTFLFLSNNLAFIIGIPLKMSLSLIIIFSIYSVFSKGSKINVKLHKPIFAVLISSLLVIVIKFSINQYEVFSDIFLIAITPILIISSFEQLSGRLHKILTKIFFAFVVLLCVVMISEYMTQTTFFFRSTEYKIYAPNFEEQDFRSFGFYAHPLIAAMVLTMSIVALQLSSYSMKIKLIITLFCFGALLVNNSRSSILLSIILYGVILFYIRNNIGQQQRKILIYGALSVLACVIYLMFTTSMGNRLLTKDLSSDESWLQRINTFKVFESLSFDSILFGDMDFTNKTLNVFGWVENGYIAWILKYGLFGIPLLLSLMYLFWRVIRLELSKPLAFCLYASLFIIAASNPHLVNFFFWCFFLFAYYASVGIKKIKRIYYRIMIERNKSEEPLVKTQKNINNESCIPL